MGGSHSSLIQNAASGAGRPAAGRGVLTPSATVLPVSHNVESVPGTWVPALLLQQNDWKDAYDRLDALASLGPAERLFYKALILDTCSMETAGGRMPDPALVAAISALAEKKFRDEATASINDPRRKAATAFTQQRTLANACKGFDTVPTTQADIARAYEEAADAGDLKAQARLLHFRQAESGRENLGKKDKRPSGFSDPITPAEREMILATLFTADPIAIRVASHALSIGTFEQSFRFGTDEVDLGAHANEIWTLVACQFGLECGARNMVVTWACGQRGQCADDYAGFLREFALTPEEFSFAERTAASIADAIRRRDTSAFRLVPQPGQSITSLTTYPPPIAIR